MTTARPFVGVVGATLVALGVRATAQVALPDGPNCDLVVRTCGTCHDISTVVDTGGRSREDWNETIAAMTSFGLNITSAERALVLQYLASYLPFPPRQ